MPTLTPRLSISKPGIDESPARQPGDGRAFVEFVIALLSSIARAILEFCPSAGARFQPHDFRIGVAPQSPIAVVVEARKEAQVMAHPMQFADVLEAADQLPPEDQENLIAILRRRLAERGRKLLAD